MFSIEIDKSVIDGANILGDKPTVRTNVRVDANEMPVTGTSDNPVRDDFLPDFCLKLLQSIDRVGNGEESVVSFSSSICELTYVPATDSTVFVNGYDSSGNPLNDSVPEPGVEVSISEVVEEHLRVCEECYRQYTGLPLSISRHPQITCLHSMIVEKFQWALDHGLLETTLPDLQRKDRLSTESDRTITVKIKNIERIEHSFDCTHQNVVLESERGEQFGVFDSARWISKQQIGTSQTVELWAIDQQQITHTTENEKRIVPSTRGLGWKNHTYRGPIREIDHCGETTVLLLEISSGCISVMVSNADVTADLSVGDFISLQAGLTELVATPP